MPNEHAEKLKSVIKGRFVVYIDAANLEQSVRSLSVRTYDIPGSKRNFSAHDLRWSVEYSQIDSFFRKLGSYLGIRFYTVEFQSYSHDKFLYFLKKGLGFKLITKPLKYFEDHTIENPHHKANFDVEIAVDSTFTIDSFDTLVLFSGDSDFQYLVEFLRGHGKTVIGFSRSGHVAKELPITFSHYFDIAKFRKFFLKIDKRQ